MRFFRLFVVFSLLFSFLLPMFSQQTHAFSMSISPARKVLTLERGDIREFDINFTNNSTTADYEVVVRDFVYEPTGGTKVVDAEDLADPSQSMQNWIQVDENFSAQIGRSNTIPIRLEVPENASYGDHYGMVTFKKAQDEESQVVAIEGGISMVLFVKVLGGVETKTGNLVSFEVRSQQRARNPVNFFGEYRNTGSQFFEVLAEVEVFDRKGDEEPIKVVRQDFTSYPNVVTPIKIALGDLGDDYGEREYYAVLTMYDFANSVKGKILSQSESPFDYYLPYTGDEPIEEVTVQNEVVVTPPIVDIVKELGLYIGGFILLVIVLIRVLFFGARRKRD